MRNAPLLIIAIFLIVVKANSQSCQSPEFQFVFDPNSSANNVSITCGFIFNNAIWVVKNDTCIMTTDTIFLSSTNCSNSGNVTEVNIRIDRDGNDVDSNDFIINNIYCGTTLVSTVTIWGDWIPDQGNSNVREVTYLVACGYPDYMIIEM
jgi:hypothetical protein